MQPPKVREVIRRLERDGWKNVGTRGDHRQFAKDGRKVTISGKMGSHMKPGTWASVKRQVGW